MTFVTYPYRDSILTKVKLATGEESYGLLENKKQEQRYKFECKTTFNKFNGLEIVSNMYNFKHGVQKPYYKSEDVPQNETY
jgi:hypothetical protein